MAPPDRGFRTVRSILPGLVVSTIAIAALIVFVDLDQAVDALLAARPLEMIAATVVFCLGLAGRAAASRELVDGRTGFGGAFAALNIGYLANNFLPLRAGEAVRSLVLGRKTGLGFVGGATAVAAERLLDVVFAATILLTGLAAVGVEATWAPAAAAAGCAAVGVIALIVVARRRGAVVAWLAPQLERWPRVAALLPRLGEALEGLARPSRLARAAAVLGASWGLAVLLFWLAMRAFIPAAPLSWAAFGLGAMAIGIALPSSPGAIGVYEAVWVGSLTLCGADSSQALAFAVAVHAMTFGITTLCGLVALALEVPDGPGIGRRIQRLLTRSENDD